MKLSTAGAYRIGATIPQALALSLMRTLMRKKPFLRAAALIVSSIIEAVSECPLANIDRQRMESA